MVDSESKEVLHFCDNSNILVSDIGNFGIYFFSVRAFSEYGMNPYQDDLRGDMISNQDNESYGGVANMTDGNSTPMGGEQSHISESMRQLLSGSSSAVGKNEQLNPTNQSQQIDQQERSQFRQFKKNKNTEE